MGSVKKQKALEWAGEAVGSATPAGRKSVCVEFQQGKRAGGLGVWENAGNGKAKDEVVRAGAGFCNFFLPPRQYGKSLAALSAQPVQRVSFGPVTCRQPRHVGLAFVGLGPGCPVDSFGDGQACRSGSARTCPARRIAGRYRAGGFSAGLWRRISEFLARQPPCERASAGSEPLAGVQIKSAES
ncbi:Hypothetical_protein [Hexamita inflata]|uniref:Hypothetical_protein n=1 Tax=Hexamita inflata TaxID=28002 RepID=A0ABP1HVF9_9EUKA